MAREVFSELGYDATTFQQIAERADLTCPAINHYFPSKQLLYREVVQETNRRVVAVAIERARRETTLIGRLSMFMDVAAQGEDEDRVQSAFLVTSMLESRRHPDLGLVEQDSLLHSREFLTWAVSEAIRTGEISTDANVTSLVEMLAAVLWGMGFYAGFVGSFDDLQAVQDNLRRLLANELWRFNDGHAAGKPT